MRTVSDRLSAQVERLEVVDTGRWRRWSEDEKLKIVLESFAGVAPSRGNSAAVWRFGPIDGNGRFGLSRRIPPVNLASYRRWWSRNLGRRLVRPRRPAAAGRSRIEFAAGARMQITAKSTRRR